MQVITWTLLFLRIKTFLQLIFSLDKDNSQLIHYGFALVTSMLILLKSCLLVLPTGFSASIMEIEFLNLTQQKLKRISEIHCQFKLFSFMNLIL